MIEWNRGHHQMIFLFTDLVQNKSSLSSYYHHHHQLFAFKYITNFKEIYSRLLGEKTSGNHHAIREATWRSQATRKSVNEFWRNSQVSFLTRIKLSIRKFCDFS